MRKIAIDDVEIARWCSTKVDVKQEKDMTRGASKGTRTQNTGAMYCETKIQGDAKRSRIDTKKCLEKKYNEAIMYERKLVGIDVLNCH